MSVPVDRFNRRTATPAQIRRATRLAQERLLRLDDDSAQDLLGIYERAAADIERQILDAAGAGNLVREERLHSLRDQVRQRVDVLSEERNGLLSERLAAAAEEGVEPWAAAVSANLHSVADEAVQFVREFVAADGLQLSDRLWRLDRGAREAVRATLENAVVQGHGASRAAQEFLQRGEPVPIGLQQRIEGARADTIAGRAAGSLVRGDRAPYEQARRVFRTELGRAHNKAFENAAFEHPDVEGTQFTLSPRHPRPDICDMHASANRYGLGPGVYPKGRNPYPAHPNTFSFIQPVFRDEISDEDRGRQETPEEWLKKQPPGVQEAVLGSAAKRKAFEQGLLSGNEINSPWRVLRRRYQQRGIDVDLLERGEGAALPGTVAPVSPPRGDDLIPVSSSLRPEAMKGTTSEVSAAIDAVHGDGDLPEIPIKRSSARSFHGIYRRVPATGRAVEIRISSKGDSPHLTLAHEIGHFLDNQAFPDRRTFSSISDPLFEDFRRAAENSRAMQQIRSLQRRRTINLPDGQSVSLPGQYIDYLARPQEQWARAYAQYIAVRSGNGKMLDELAADRSRVNAAPVQMPRQWEDDDFEPIAQSIDEILRAKGWL